MPAILKHSSHNQNSHPFLWIWTEGWVRHQLKRVLVVVVGNSEYWNTEKNFQLLSFDDMAHSSGNVKFNIKKSVCVLPIDLNSNDWSLLFSILFFSLGGKCYCALNSALLFYSFCLWNRFLRPKQHLWRMQSISSLT